MAKKLKCRVSFDASRFGVDAVLWWRGRSINVMPLGHSPTAAAKKRARAKLMRGCHELAAHRARSDRRDRRYGLR
jgi:hypothetical protein